MHLPSTVQEMNNEELLWQTHLNLPTGCGGINLQATQKKRLQALASREVWLRIWGGGGQCTMQGYGKVGTMRDIQRLWVWYIPLTDDVIQVACRQHSTFSILGNSVRLSLGRVPKLTVSYAVLHNVGKHRKDA
ncbi:hypothetical protein PR048_005099 [Dryococelus australis]|uniref:Uncharacterized protein n=1 Tax=Dryococelus australis TaxID=614101 RepID=A0ABQ9I793_9NEOP|nr:hypothetical protein PR048_005099 [Dryococelus australis]